jgi:prepilin signal peptidase PulO-like enzyme (type II secretory pathway)
MSAYVVCPGEWFGVAYLSAVALVLFRTDWQDMVLHDTAQIALVLGALFFRGQGLGIAGTIEMVLWACGAGASVWCIGRIYKTIKGYDGIGEGDALLVASLSLWLSPSLIPIMLACASFATAAWGYLAKKEIIPLGAFLSLSAPIIILLERLL